MISWFCLFVLFIVINDVVRPRFSVLDVVLDSFQDLGVISGYWLYWPSSVDGLFAVYNIALFDVDMRVSGVFRVKRFIPAGQVHAELHVRVLGVHAHLLPHDGHAAPLRALRGDADGDIHRADGRRLARDRRVVHLLPLRLAPRAPLVRSPASRLFCLRGPLLERRDAGQGTRSARSRAATSWGTGRCSSTRPRSRATRSR